MSTFDFEKFSEYLGRFDFSALFTQVIGWNHPPASERHWQEGEHKGTAFQYRMTAEMSGVAVLEVVCNSGWPDEATRMSLWRHLSRSHYENLLIFLDQTNSPSQSLWYWVKRTTDTDSGKQKTVPRRHEYFRGQPADLFASKLKSMVVELSELDARGRIPVLEVVRRMETALDVEKTTRRFYSGYQEQHEQLLLHIKGIDNERDRRWYASVILNRLMFVWFLQKKLFLNNKDEHYLLNKLKESRRRGPDRFYGEFLNALFFEAFAKPETERSPEVKTLTGVIPYLNGGLFLYHKLEEDDSGQPRVGITLHISDAAFDGIFQLFSSYSWHLDDTPAGSADELNPDVLGYIFEKYINQKAFGAYYTRPEITGYLAERSIHRLILERVRQEAMPALGLPAVSFPTVADMLARMDARTALRLVNEVLPSLTILDPAVGSGAFLVAALKVLINIYYAIVGRAELGASKELDAWLKAIRRDHFSVGYYIKRKIVTDNLYGVDIMEEACEIAKLRLFLAMVASVRRVGELEPLPNIDFNILPGNSLVGLIHVDPARFDSLTAAPVINQPAKGKECDTVAEPGLDFGAYSTTVRKDLTAEYRSQSKIEKFSRLLEEKNRKLAIYRNTSQLVGQNMDLRRLRDDIDDSMKQAGEIMNQLLQDSFAEYGIKFEQAVWDKAKATVGKPAKRNVTVADVTALHPFHWGYVFDEIMQKRGGFDIIITNPPWEIVKPQAKEFFDEHSEFGISKNKMTIKEFEKEQEKLLKDGEIRAAWLEYLSRFPHLSAWFRAAPQFRHQSAIVGGKKTGSDINLYKLFTEQCANLLREGGDCGIVIPSGIYTDLGAKGLRDMLFDENRVTGLFCFENRKEIFEGVHRSFKFIVLTFEKGGSTEHFPTAFMRLDVAELERFPMEGALDLQVELIRRLSPDSHSLMEFKSDMELKFAAKISKHPVLDSQDSSYNHLRFTREIDPTAHPEYFSTTGDSSYFHLIEGRNIHQFTHVFSTDYRFWLKENDGRKLVLGREEDIGQPLDYQVCRLGFRKIARNTDERTMISTIVPPSFVSENFQTVCIVDCKGQPIVNKIEMLLLCSIFNSFVFDAIVRLKVTANMNFFYVYSSQVPKKGSAYDHLIVKRTAKLICITPEFDDLAKEAGIGSHKQGVTNEVERARLRAELDGLIAHLYGLTEEEFAHILTTFPLVPEPTKIAAQNAYRDVERGLIT